MKRSILVAVGLLACLSFAGNQSWSIAYQSGYVGIRSSQPGKVKLTTNIPETGYPVSVELVKDGAFGWYGQADVQGPCVVSAEFRGERSTVLIP